MWKTAVSGGGFARLYFGYGSRYDNIDEDGSLKGTNTMIIYICDDCFERKFKLVECWRMIQPRRTGTLVKANSPDDRREMKNPFLPNPLPES
jgi:hypothetical protein